MHKHFRIEVRNAAIQIYSGLFWAESNRFGIVHDRAFEIAFELVDVVAATTVKIHSTRVH